MRILIIANPIVGIRKEKKRILDDIVGSIRKKGNVADVTFIMKPGAGKRYASRSTLEGYDAVYSAGGDGTLNEVASGLVGSNMPLGIIPLGTGNGFARSLGIPRDTRELVNILIKGNTRAVDTGEFSGRHFVSTAGIGYDAAIADDFNRHRRTRTNLIQYMFIAVKKYFQTTSEEVQLTIDGQKSSRSLFGLSVCNTSQYGGGAVIAPDTDPTDGKLTAVIIPKLSIVKAPGAIFRLFNGKLSESDGVEYISFKTLRIRRKNAGPFQTDGEAQNGGKTLDVRVVPESLQIIVP